MGKSFIRKKTSEKSQTIQKEIYDPFADFQGSKLELYLAKLFYYFRKNLKLSLGILSFVLVVFVGIVFYHVYTENLEKRSLLAFEELLKSPIFQAGASDIGTAINKLENYQKEFQNKSAQKRAIIKKIELYQEQRDYENVAIQYEELAKLLEYPELKQYAYLNAAIHFENQKKYSRALSNIEEILKYEIPNEYLKAYVLFTQVRLLYHLGKKEDARRISKKVYQLDIQNHPEISKIQSELTLFFLINSEP
ncbi:MAG: tetratricopeptide repeat protein [Leptospiraceae bacterium]|nr:tetratricopeptide repeat protein [Leptospiraceae bacterium]MDW7976465.1 tetratricopeptide repeat protein [Leptospiraceae bacterium]